MPIRHLQWPLPAPYCIDTVTMEGRQPRKQRSENALRGGKKKKMGGDMDGERGEEKNKISRQKPKGASQ